MQVSASIRRGRALLHYGEFDSFENADKHLTSEGWKCVGRYSGGVSWRWEYWRGGELMTVREDVEHQ